IYKIQQILIALLFLTAMPLTAQVLLSEDFENHSLGDYITGEGGLYAVKGGTSTYVWVTLESGRGNILTIRHTSSSYVGAGGIRQSQGVMDSLWNNRLAGNDILKFEFEFYGASN